MVDFLWKAYRILLWICLQIEFYFARRIFLTVVVVIIIDVIVVSISLISSLIFHIFYSVTVSVCFAFEFSKLLIYIINSIKLFLFFNTDFSRYKLFLMKKVFFNLEIIIIYIFSLPKLPPNHSTCSSLLSFKFTDSFKKILLLYVYITMYMYMCMYIYIPKYNLD